MKSNKYTFSVHLRHGKCLKVACLLLLFFKAFSCFFFCSSSYGKHQKQHTLILNVKKNIKNRRKQNQIMGIINCFSIYLFVRLCMLCQNASLPSLLSPPPSSFLLIAFSFIHNFVVCTIKKKSGTEWKLLEGIN